MNLTERFNLQAELTNTFIRMSEIARESNCSICFNHDGAVELISGPSLTMIDGVVQLVQTDDFGTKTNPMNAASDILNMINEQE